MNILGLIPARGGSKGIPRKNIAELGGRPLISWTIAAARAVPNINRVVVSTDDEEIAAVARREGADVPFMRPPDLASDTAAALPVIRHAVEALDASGFRADVIVYLQPTSPFRGSAPIERAVEMLAKGDADTVVTVVRVPHSMTPDSLMRWNGEFLEFVASPEARSFRRQEKLVFFARNGPAVLALTRDVVMNAGELYGPRIKGIEMGMLESLDIDEPLDFIVAEALLPVVAAERAAGRI